MKDTFSEAIEQLRMGNERFVQGTSQWPNGADRTRPALLASAQSPFCVVVGCADSRVPPELVFDQDLGDLFVVRVAGNVVSSFCLASVEFAVSQLGASLVLVLGHSACGAVQTAAAGAGSAGSPHLDSLVEEIAPAVEAARDAAGGAPHADLVDLAVTLNVRNSVSRLQEASAIIGEAVREEQLLVVGARYDLETGQVTFLDL